MIACFISSLMFIICKNSVFKWPATKFKVWVHFQLFFFSTPNAFASRQVFQSAIVIMSWLLRDKNHIIAIMSLSRKTGKLPCNVNK